LSTDMSYKLWLRPFCSTFVAFFGRQKNDADHEGPLIFS
jgi:hypothetical protein